MPMSPKNTFSLEVHEASHQSDNQVSSGALLATQQAMAISHGAEFYFPLRHQKH